VDEKLEQPEEAPCEQSLRKFPIQVLASPSLFISPLRLVMFYKIH